MVGYGIREKTNEINRIVPRTVSPIPENGATMSELVSHPTKQKSISVLRLGFEPLV